MEELQSVKAPRCLQQNGNSVKNVLHTFVDASQHTYGAVVCMREEHEDRTVSVRLAKTRITPQNITAIFINSIYYKI